MARDRVQVLRAAGLPQARIAAIDASGKVTSWATPIYGPERDLEVNALAARDSTVYVGGYFSGFNLLTSEYFAALDAGTGAIRGPYFCPDGVVSALALSEGKIYLAGGFGRVGPWPVVGFAALTAPPRSGPVVIRKFELAQSVPNPVSAEAVIGYTLPATMAVTLTVFDLQGRARARVLAGVPQSAGPHQASVSTAGWRPGVYLYRLEAGGASATRKMLVVK